MSLINDMLKDLDGDASENTKPALPSGLSESAEKRRSPRTFVLLACAAGAVIYGLMVVFVPKKSPPVVEIPKPIALNSKWLKEGPAASADSHNIPATDPHAPSAAPIPVGKVELNNALHSTAEISPSAMLKDGVASSANNLDEIARHVPPQSSAPPQPSHIENLSAYENTALDHVGVNAVQKLLQAGAQALANKRLTTPAGDNAYQFFTSALLLDPNNADAKAGIEQIQQQYVSWYEQARANDQHQVAQLYWQRARATGVNTEALRTYAQNDAPAVPLATLSASAETAVIKDPVITPAISDRDGVIAARLQNDGLVMAETEAWQWLKQGDELAQTATLLTDLYAAVGDQTKLANLYQLLSSRGAPAAHYVAAQLARQQQNFAEAAQELEAITLQGGAEQRRLRSLAGLHQHLKNYQKSLPLYQQLVRLQPDNVNDWLGLAISADAQKMPVVALQAFQKVLRLTHPDPRVMRFAQQRQQDLSFSTSSR